MRHDDVTKRQCASLRNKASEMLAYLHRLNRRMGEKGFPEDDTLRLVVPFGRRCATPTAIVGAHCGRNQWMYPHLLHT
jgi:hypothetical protein